MTKPLSKKEKKARAKARASTVEIKKKTPAKPKKKPVTKTKKEVKLSSEALSEVDYLVDYIRDEGTQTIGMLLAASLYESVDEAKRVIADAVKLGRITTIRIKGRPSHIYRLVKAKKKPATEAKKAVKTELSDKDLNDVEEIVDFLMDNCPDRSPPVTAGELDSEAIGGPQVLRNALKLGRIVKDGDGYRLNKGGDVAMGALAILQKVEEESVRCNEELVACKKELKESRDHSQAQAKENLELEAALREKADMLEGEIVGWELRSNVQVLTYRFERWEHDRLRDAYVTTVRWLENWLVGMGLKGSGEWAVDEWEAWAQREKETLVQGLTKMKPFQKRQRPLTEVRPEPPEDTHKMITLMMSQLASQDAGWGPAPGKKT